MQLLCAIPEMIRRVVHGRESTIRPVGWTRNGSLPRPGISLIAGLVIPLLLSSAGVGLAQIVDTTLWVTDGQVNAIVADGSTIYIGGNFTQVGPPTGSAVVIDSITGAPQQPYPKVAGTVHAITPDGSGGWYVGGAFTAVRGQPRSNLAQLDASGNLTAWDPNANGEVDALVVSGGTVYAGGGFTSIGGQPRSCIAAVDAASGAATAWNPNALGGSPSTTVYALALSGGTVYAGGNFTYIGGQDRNRIAALDAAGGAATAWDPNADNLVRALCVSGDTVYAGGGFTNIGGQVRNRIAALDAATGAAIAWNPNANGSVYALAVSGETVYAGGIFTNIGGWERSSIAALYAANSHLTSLGFATAWNPNAGGDGSPSGPLSTFVYSLAVSGGTVYAGGTFTSIGGQPRNKIAALDAASGDATAWSPAFSGSRYTIVHALAVSAGKVYAGGNFITIGGLPRNQIAALDAASGAATSWNPNATGGSWQGHFGFQLVGVEALALGEGTVYAGGHFDAIGGAPRSKIAALDAITGAATTWNPSGFVSPFIGYDPSVYTLAVSGGTVYVAGFFQSIGGQPRNRVGALDAATGAVTAWNPDPSPTPSTPTGVAEMVVSGGTVYVGGNFGRIGGVPRNNIAALDTTTGAATAWNPNANGEVGALATSGSTVYAGGSFTSIGGQLRSRIAALDGTTGAATAWDPYANGSVGALAISGGTVYVDGAFTSIGGQPRNIAALSAATGAANAWDANPNGTVNTLAVNGGKVYIGGSFTTIDGLPQANIVAISEGYLLSVGGDPSMIEGALTVVPNPTRAGMQIQYSVARSGRVRLEVLDVSGRVEATLADRVQEPGRHAATWDGVGRRGRLSPGLHFIRLVAPDGVMVRKLAIIQ